LPFKSFCQFTLYQYEAPPNSESEASRGARAKRAETGTPSITYRILTITKLSLPDSFLSSISFLPLTFCLKPHFSISPRYAPLSPDLSPFVTLPLFCTVFFPTHPLPLLFPSSLFLVPSDSSSAFSLRLNAVKRVFNQTSSWTRARMVKVRQGRQASTSEIHPLFFYFFFHTSLKNPTPLLSQFSFTFPRFVRFTYTYNLSEILCNPLPNSSHDSCHL